MKRVDKNDKKEWGSRLPDRRDSFDDDNDIKEFKKLCHDNPDMSDYIRKFVPEGEYKWISKPNGKYGIDIALVNRRNGKQVLLVDLERWNYWKNDWPSYYKYVHFLGRKDHFLNSDKPFLIVYLSYDASKVILVDKDTLKKYRTESKYFKVKKRWDLVKVLPMSEGHIFGKNLTTTEINNFQ